MTEKRGVVLGNPAVGEAKQFSKGRTFIPSEQPGVYDSAGAPWELDPLPVAGGYVIRGNLVGREHGGWRIEEPGPEEWEPGCVARARRETRLVPVDPGNGFEVQPNTMAFVIAVPNNELDPPLFHLLVEGRRTLPLTPEDWEIMASGE